MTRSWISIIVVLLGAKLNAEMEHQTVYESTIGQPRPIGRRGARMADTVGAAQALRWIGDMLTISEAQRLTELFLTGQMLEALRAVEYELPSFDTKLHDVDLTEV